jgi:hypothetical protein
MSQNDIDIPLNRQKTTMFTQHTSQLQSPLQN